MTIAKRVPCPYLPPAPAERWTHAALTRLGPRRDGVFFETALTYAQVLWLKGFTARAILAATRGLYCPLRGDDPALNSFTWPYAAIGWLIREHPGDTFLGNPRISFQHQADRMKGSSVACRSARAWAVWHIVRVVAPELPTDPKHTVTPPSHAADLTQYGAHGEASIWQEALAVFA